MTCTLRANLKTLHCASLSCFSEDIFSRGGNTVHFCILVHSIFTASFTPQKVTMFMLHSDKMPHCIMHCKGCHLYLFKIQIHWVHNQRAVQWGREASYRCISHKARNWLFMQIHWETLLYYMAHTGAISASCFKLTLTYFRALYQVEAPNKCLLTLKPDQM